MSFHLRMLVAERNVDVRFDVADGETVAILGPNGAGKSTIVSAIAGLLRPDSGRSILDGTVLFDLPDTPRTPRGPRTPTLWRAPHRRGVSLLAQEALLFPHLTARENVAFGPRSAGIRPRQSRAIATRWLEEVDATGLAERTPAELSGGQAQRIAVARALASDPGLLLLDEPMAALDVSVAPALRRMLRRVLADRSAVIITHDVLDAYTLADRVIILEGGRIVDEGTPAQVFDRPRSAFAAELTGVNLLAGVRRGPHVVLPGAATFLEIGDLASEPDGAALLLAIRPADVSVSLDEPADSSLVSFPVTMTDLEPRGDSVRIRSSLLAADVTPKQAAELDVATGSALWFSFPREAATLYAATPPAR